MKVGVEPEEREQVLAIVNIFRAKIVDVSEDSMIVELTGSQSKVDAFIRLINGFTIREMARTGITGLGKMCIRDRKARCAECPLEEWCAKKGV